MTIRRECRQDAGGRVTAGAGDGGRFHGMTSQLSAHPRAVGEERPSAGHDEAGAGNTQMSRRNALVSGAASGACAVTALGACTSGTAGGPQLPLYSGQQTTVEAAFAGAVEEHEVRKAQVAAFAQKQPKITIDYQVIDNGNRFGWLTARFAAGSPPDHVWTTIGYHQSLVGQGGMKDLSPYVKADRDVKPDAYFKDPWAFLTVDGKLTALPAELGPIVLYYSPTAFEKAGVAPPTDSWTWDDWLTSSQRVVRANGDFSGMPFTPGTHWFWASFLLTAGGQVLDKAGQKLTLNTPEGRDAFQYIVDLVHRYRVMPPQGTQLPPTPFPAGAVAMEVSGAFTLARNNDFGRQAGFRYDVVRFPKRKGRTTTATMVENGVAASSKVPEATWEFVKFLSGRDGLEIVAQKQFALPALNDPKLAETFAKANTQPKNVNAFFEQAKDLSLAWQGAKQQDMLRELNDVLGPMWRGERSVQDSLRDADERVNRTVFNVA
jgi:multiple sugar transport system substrate-binding protein